MNRIIFGDCRATMRELIADGVKVQTCVTSPPYWGLRDYGTASWDGGDVECDHIQPVSSGSSTLKNDRRADDKVGWRGADVAAKTQQYRDTCRKCGATRVDKQLGIEPTIDEYVANMVEVFRLVRDLLADDGTLWLNLGDSYVAPNGRSSTGKGYSNGPNSEMRHMGEAQNAGIKRIWHDLPAKNLCGIPWRVAFALQADGWYLRQDIIWSKPNPMPESVTDRCTKAHEYLFLLSKRERYYYDADAIKEEVNGTAHRRGAMKTPDGWDTSKGEGSHGSFHKNGREKGVTPKSAPVGSGIKANESFEHAVWDLVDRRNKRSVWTVATQPYSEAHFATFPPDLIRPCVLAGSRPGDVVFDPFMGSGTTAQVAKEFGRQYLGCELNPDYEPLQTGRTRQQVLALA